MFGGKEKSRTFASAIEKQTSKLRNAQMAESVDALVSNTSGFTSIPVRPRVWVHRKPLKLLMMSSLRGFFCTYRNMAETLRICFEIIS